MNVSFSIVGSTGSGKSTLASFLYDSMNYEDTPKFQRANSSNPQSREVQVEHFSYNSKHYRIIDTPGLNEGKDPDVLNMIKVCEEVKKSKEISSVVICHRLDSKMDTQFENTIKYYSDFFHLFKDRNIILMITNVAMDARTVRKRKIDGFDLQKNIDKISESVRSIAKLNYDPMIFCIDANPIYDEQDSEYLGSCKIRSQLLDYIIKLSPVPTSSLQFKKTPSMVHADEILVGNVEGKMRGYMAAIEQGKFEELEIIKKVEEILNMKNKKMRLLDKYEQEFLELDSDELQQIDLWQVTRDWNYSWNDTMHIIQKPYYFEVIKTAPPDFTWQDLPENDKPNLINDKFQLTVRLIGSWFRGVQASVTVYSKKRDIYKEILEEKKKKINILKNDLEVLGEKENLNPQEEKTIAEMRKLRDYMEQCYRELNELQTSTISIEKAKERLNIDMHGVEQQKFNFMVKNEAIPYVSAY